MGVDTQIRLPCDVRVRDVGNVIGILAGLPSSKHSLGGESYSCRVEGVKVAPSSIAECCSLTFDGKMVDGALHHWVLYHFENEHNGRLLLPRACPFWICVARGLVNFFGGSVDYQDCDTVDTDYQKEKPRKQNNPSDGKPWHDFQDALLALRPITKKELERAQKWAGAAYKNL